MPISKKTGKRYAAGSQTTLGGWEPKTCCICGEKTVVSGKRALQFHFDDTTKTGYSMHVDCKKENQGKSPCAPAGS
jgi:hypothetical protein